MPSRGARLAPSLLLALGLALPAAGARAESALELPYPTSFETIPAATYDENGARVGDAHLVVEKLASGNVRLLSEVGVDGGARTIAFAEMAPMREGETLRVIKQESRSFDPSGQPLGVLSIDHHTGRGSCAPPDADDEDTQVLELGRSDRVANVPFNLLFVPLLSGERESVEFQLMICRGGPRVLDFEARVAESNGNGSGRFIEVRYGPDVGSVGSFFLRGVLPKLSFWFDRSAPHPWLAHRLPLYSKGPEVFVVREGIPAEILVEH